MFLLFLDIILPVFLIAGLAMAAQSWLKLDTHTLSRAGLYIFTPALLFDALSTAKMDGAQMGGMALVIVGVLLILWGVGAGLARVLRLRGTTRSAFLLNLLLMNVGNYGLPVLEFAFGEAGLAMGSLYLVLFTLATVPIGIYVAAPERASPLGALRRVAAMPMVPAAIAGLIFGLLGWSLPEPVSKAVHLLGQAANPIFLVLLGFQLHSALQGGLKGHQVPALLALLAVRLLLSPLLAWGLGRAVGLSGLAFKAMVLDFAFPSAVMGAVLSTEFEADTGFATLGVFSTTVVSLLTVTLWLGLVI